MSGFLLDTNVISEYSRAGPPDVRVKRWVDTQNEDTLYLKCSYVRGDSQGCDAFACE